MLLVVAVAVGNDWGSEPPGAESGGKATPSEGGRNPGGGAFIAEGAVRE